MPPRIGIVAGEASGDLLGGLLVSSLKKRMPDAEFFGIAGPKMQAAGAKSLFPMEKLSVMGYVEVLKRYREISGIRKKLIARLLADPPDVFIGVDAPDFNLKIEETLKKKGIPAVHYVSPSIWAWRGERIRKIARATSRVLALFPFEAPIYEKANIPVSFVGHPLADLLPETPDRAMMRDHLKLPPEARIIALMPGSREGEVRRHADIFVQAAKIMKRRWSNAQFLVPLISRETRMMFEDAIYRQGAEEIPFTLLFGHAADALTAADGVLIASGTATLEAMLLKRPMVITYKMANLTYRLASRKLYLPYVGLPNILAGEFVVPEILQDEATPENLAQALINLVEDEVTVARLEKKFSAIHRSLARDNAEAAAEAIMPYLR